MKIAFIAHAIGVGGGSLSSSTTIQYLIDKGLMKPEDCIIIHNKVLEISTEKNDLYFNLKKSIKSYIFRLPFSSVYKGATPSVIIRLYRSMMDAISLFYFLFFYNKILKHEHISVVHLNSIVLWPLLLILPRSMKKVIHIREVPNNSIMACVAIFIIRHFATKIISIDPISDISFSSSGKSIIIFNPVNMTKSRQLRSIKNLVKTQLGITPDTFVVSIIGRVEKQKGFDYFIKVVESSVPIKNLVFLIIGKSSGEYGEKCIKILKGLPNVKCMGEHPDSSKFYAITDVVIRCEDYLPLGRTVWEGIFAGGLVLVPVNKNDDISVIQEYIGKYIFTYQALNVDSCIEMLKKIMKLYPDTVLDTDYPVTDNISISSEHFFNVIKS